MTEVSLAEHNNVPGSEMTGMLIGGENIWPVGGALGNVSAKLTVATAGVKFSWRRFSWVAWL